MVTVSVIVTTVQASSPRTSGEIVSMRSEEVWGEQDVPKAETAAAKAATAMAKNLILTVGFESGIDREGVLLGWKKIVDMNAR
jgi:hypothetical protein